jgi:ribosome-associated protein
MAELNKSISPPTSEVPTTPANAPAPARRLVGHEIQDDVPFNAAARSQPERMARALEHARICARIADDNRARDVLVLDLRQATPLVDFFVIATANSRRQSHAIASEIDQEMKRLGEHKLGIEGSEEGRWILIDYGDFVVHVFSGEARNYYALEDIWGDAPRLDWQDPDRVRPAPRDEAPADPSE